MSVDSEAFKKLKPKAKDEIVKRFNDIESELNIKIPTTFMQLVDEEFEANYPNNLEEFCNWISCVYDNFISFSDDLVVQSEKLDSQCIDFIDRLITQLYSKTNGNGLGNNSWSHFPKIWNLHQIASDMDKISYVDLSVEFTLNQILTAYVQIYELTIHFLVDITQKIAYKQRREDGESKKFCKLYRKRKMNDMTLSRGELINFLNTQDFLNGWNCSIIQDSYIRNKIAHADYYYESDSKKLIFGNKSYGVETVRNIFYSLYGFYCYLLLTFLEEGNFFDLLDKMKEIKESIENLTS
ncbi:hypothetical protein [Methanolobus bombayensis]|uniref:hypothetical protein n=1 Tax=Methanolobus bombayensis TaxID=38023 RepID=UPI001AE1615E|nr:hypothetical protein [Methanolobus bombayensis]MBP1908448.1 hypothetical protein [Methanolobus bombayensis]